MGELVARERARQQRLAVELGLGADVLDACSDLLARWDGLSLALCGGRDAGLEDWPFAVDEFVATVDARELRPVGGGIRSVALRLRPREAQRDDG